MELYKYHPQGGVRTLMEHPLVQAARQCRSKGSVVTMSLAVCGNGILLPEAKLARAYCRQEGTLMAELLFSNDKMYLLEVYRQEAIQNGITPLPVREFLIELSTPAHFSYWLEQFVLGERCSASFVGRLDDPASVSLVSGVFNFPLG